MRFLLTLALFTLPTIVTAQPLHDSVPNWVRDAKVRAAAYDLPKLFQGRGSVHRVSDWSGRYGSVHPNLSFPWRDPAGLHQARGWEVRRTISLPQGEQVKVWQEDGRTRWSFPAGTVFEETATQDGIPWEVRVRAKRADGRWRIDAFRPFPTLKDLEVVTGPEDPNYYALRFHHREVTQWLRETPFKSALNTPWSDKRESPFADQFSIVPPGYRGVETSHESCMNCHSDAGTLIQARPEWWGRVRGDDGIFSWHPFDGSGRLRDEFKEQE